MYRKYVVFRKTSKAVPVFPTGRSLVLHVGYFSALLLAPSKLNYGF